MKALLAKTATRSLRLLAATGVLAAMVFVANVPSHGTIRLVGAAIALLAAGMAVVIAKRLAARWGIDRAVAERSGLHRMGMVLGCIGLVAAAVLATAKVSPPGDAAVVARGSTCGSALLAPQLPAIADSATRAVDQVSLDEDCNDPRNVRSGWAIFIAECGLLLIVLSLLRPRVLGANASRTVATEAPRPSARRWAALPLAAVIITLFVGIDATPRTIRLTNSNPNPADLHWELEVLSPTIKISFGLDRLLDQYKKRDWGAMAQTCRSLQPEAAALAPVANSIPPDLSAVAEPFATFRSETTSALDYCVTAADRRDLGLFSKQVGPRLVAAGKASKAMQAIEEAVHSR